MALTGAPSAAQTDEPDACTMPPADATASYVHGASAQALIGETLGRYFDAACARHAEREALVVRHQGVRLRYAELRGKVDALAVSFLRLGLAPGERLAIWSPNALEWVLTQFATAKAGLVLVNINPAYRRSELEYALAKVGCRALVLAASFKSSDYLGMLADVVPELAACRPGALVSARLPELRTVIRLGAQATPGMLNFDALLEAPTAEEQAALQALGARLQFDDPINIQFTSGTTGSPTGATLSHHNILNNGFFTGEAIRLAPGDRVCIPVPLYHCFGMVMGNLGALTHGATMVYPSEGFDPLATLQAVAEERCTALYGVPTMFIAQLDHPAFAQHDLGSLRTGIMAGSLCPVEVMRAVIERMHLREVTIAYGMTETSPVSFQSAVEDTIERRVSTVGRVHPHCEVKLVDEAGRLGHDLACCQKNQEGLLIERIHAAKTEGVAFILFNPGAFTHTSIALRDALLGVAIPFIEVHLSNVHARESFRHHSYLSDIAAGVIVGLGPIGYRLALLAAHARLAGTQ
ncbi:MAG: hypothetical protein NVS9B10_25180 [Nevskia sp.]